MICDAPFYTAELPPARAAEYIEACSTITEVIVTSAVKDVGSS